MTRGRRRFNRTRRPVLEAWGTIPALSRALKISQTMLRNVVREDRIRSCVARDTLGRMVVTYPLKDVRRAVDRRGMKPMAREGFFFVDGEEWGTLSAIAERLEESRASLQVRARTLRSRVGVHRGRTTVFYALQDIRRVTADGNDLPRADKDGFVMLDGELYGTVRALARTLRPAPEAC